jgi:uncharacterized membrane protein HdeD (DUF308 family)
MAGQQVTLPMRARGLAIVVGLVSIAAAVVVLLFPSIAGLTLVLILGAGLIVHGSRPVSRGHLGACYGGCGCRSRRADSAGQ